MLRGYRFIVVAFGVILLGAGPPNPEQRANENKTTTAQEQQPLEDIAASLRKANEPSGLDEPCQKGRDNRNSDLCAQWKAADAAQSAAAASWLFGTIGTLVGVLTLAAAAAAAWFARQAANHTGSSVVEAQRTANAAEETLAATLDAYEIQMRPYVAICSVDEDEPEQFGRDAIVKFNIKNFGQTPATSVYLSIGEAGVAEPIGDFIVPLEGKGGNYGLLAPGDVRKQNIHCRDLSLDNLADLAGGQIKFLVRLRIDYTWLDGADCHDITVMLEDFKTSNWILVDEKRRRDGK